MPETSKQSSESLVVSGVDILSPGGSYPQQKRKKKDKSATAESNDPPRPFGIQGTSPQPSVVNRAADASQSANIPGQPLKIAKLNRAASAARAAAAPELQGTLLKGEDLQIISMSPPTTTVLSVSESTLIHARVRYMFHSNDGAVLDFYGVRFPKTDQACHGRPLHGADGHGYYGVLSEGQIFGAVNWTAGQDPDVGFFGVGISLLKSPLPGAEIIHDFGVGICYTVMH